MTCRCHAAEHSHAAVEHELKFKALAAFIDGIPPAEKAERRRGVLISILHRAQEIFGYLPEEVQLVVARSLDISPAEVYGVVSFYNYFNDKPVGRIKINVCIGTACFVKGAEAVLSEFKRQLNCEENASTEDGQFYLGTLRCVGACSLAPVVRVDERIFGCVTPEMVASIIESCNEEEKSE